MTTIISKNSSTAGAVPTSGDLVQGEIAVNVTDKKLYTKNASGTVVQITPAVNDMGFKNRIINGAMMIDQRNAGASITPTTTGTYGLDRWRCGLSVTSKYSVQQSSTAPAGFKNSLLVTSTSAYSVGTGETYNLTQYIEGLNASDLGFGSASASAVTLSFWVRSSLTGTFGGSLRNDATDRSYPFSYTINAANTWEQKTLTIPGDTTGTWLTTTAAGIALTFSLGSSSTFNGTVNTWQSGNLLSVTGATSVVGTNGATFYITGVQLEKGSTATSFDFRDYGRELMLCQRYYCTQGVGNNESAGFVNTVAGPAARATVFLPVSMRAAPSFSTTVSSFSIRQGGSDAALTSLSVITYDPRSTYVSMSGITTLANGNFGSMFTNGSGQLIFSAEL